MTELTTAWQKLRPEPGAQSGYVRLRLASIAACATYAARRISDQREALIVEIATGSLPSSGEYPQSAGFVLTAEALAPGRFGKARLLLCVSHERFSDVFRAMCEDVTRCLSAASDEPDAVRALVSRLGRWQAFFRKHDSGELSAAERRGLFGELYFLHQLLDAGFEPCTAVAAWKGCDAANHDFQLVHGSLEVKTTSANTPHSFRVSNVGQLSGEGIEALFLKHVVVDESEGAEFSLAQLVARVRTSLGGRAVDHFEECLLRSGYHDVHQPLYSSPRYTVRSDRYFHVTEGFPRLLAAALPAGVENVAYSVALAACIPFECTEATVLHQLLPHATEA